MDNFCNRTEHFAETAEAQALQLLEQLDSLFTTLNGLSQTHKKPFDGDLFYTDQQLSERLHISRRTLQEWRNAGILDYITLGGKILYRESSINTLLLKHHHPAW